MYSRVSINGNNIIIIVIIDIITTHYKINLSEPSYRALKIADAEGGIHILLYYDTYI